MGLGLRLDLAHRLIVAVASCILIAAVSTLVLVILSVCLGQNVRWNCLLRLVEEIGAG